MGGCVTCWVRLQTNIKSQKKLDKKDEPLKDNQSMSGKLKSPTKCNDHKKTVGLQDTQSKNIHMTHMLREEHNIVHRIKLLSTPNSTVTISRSGGEDKHTI